MKILTSTGIFKPELGGPAVFAAELSSKLVLLGHSVTVLTYSNAASYPFDKEYAFSIRRIVRKNNKFFNYISYFWASWKLVKGYDVIYGLDWFSAGFPLMLACFFRGKRYMVRVGGGYIWEKYLAEGKPPVTLRQFYERGLYKDYRLMRLIIKIVLKRADIVVFNSAVQLKLYEKYYSLRPGKLYTVYNAGPEQKFTKLIASYRTRSTERDMEIVFAGRFIKMKNVESLVSAFALLPGQSFRLTLIGNGPLAASLRAQVVQLGISDRVEFIPAMSLEGLYRRIANSYLVVIPSWTDVSPHQAYECLLMKIPFLLTKENYLPIEGDMPMTIDPTSIEDIARKISLLLDPAAYKKFNAALQKIKFSRGWDEVVAEHLALFSKLA
jgi:glycosyltransferase involved in cell wall biosynthesis